MSALVVYYSKTGYTKLLAEAAAKFLGADLFALEESAKRSAGPNYFVNGFSASFGLASKVAALPDLTRYDTVYVGTPIWAGKCVPAVNRLLKDGALAGRTVIGFATQLGTSNSASAQVQKAVAKKGGMFGGFYTMIVAQGVKPEDGALQAFVASWKK